MQRTSRKWSIKEPQIALQRGSLEKMMKSDPGIFFKENRPILLVKNS